MATKLHGYINLSRIPEGLITTNRAGDRVIWVDVIERRSAGRYGETHSITCYDSRSRETTYLADLTPQAFGGGGRDGGNGGGTRPQHEDDLPF